MSDSHFTIDGRGSKYGPRPVSRFKGRSKRSWATVWLVLAIVASVGLPASSPSAGKAPQAQAQSAPGTPTVLIFRDGHREEIQNYAIIGTTLWVLDERNSTKISVFDLDLDATQKENRSRGLRFPLSELPAK